MLHPKSPNSTYHLEPLADVVRRLWAECFPEITLAPHDPKKYAESPHRLENVMAMAGDALAAGEIEAYLRDDAGQLWAVGPECWRDPPRAFAMLKGSVFNAPQATCDPAVRRAHLATVYAARDALEPLKTRLQGKPDRTAVTPPSKAKLQRWYETWIRKNEVANRIPSREEDIAAAKAELGAGCTNAALRSLRKDLAPEHWKIPGRPNGGARKRPPF